MRLVEKDKRYGQSVNDKDRIFTPFVKQATPVNNL